MPVYQLTVNQKKYKVEADADTPLLWVLRDQLNLVGTKYGCGIAQCGACSVHLEGKVVRACALPIAALQNKNITTIEGLDQQALLEAWKEIDVPQCGYCQAGQLMSAAALLKENPRPTDEEIDKAMQGNICRCGTYLRIKQAIKVAANAK